MSVMLQEPIARPEAEDARFETIGDLRMDGRFGVSRLVVTDEAVYRYETTPIAEELIARYPLKELKNPRVEDLVDATALIADIENTPVELLRTTSRRALQVAGAEKRLKALLEGEPMPELDDQVRLCPKCGRPLPEHSDVCEGCLSRGKTMLRLFQYTTPYRSRIIWGTFLTFLGTAINLVPPYLTMRLIDDVLRNGNRKEFVPLILLLLGIQFAIAVVSIARSRNVAFLGMRIAVAIRHSLFEKFQQLSLGFYDKRNVGSIMSRMTNDTSALYDVLVDGIPVVLNQGAMLVGIPIALLLINWRVGIWALVPIPVVLFAVRWFRRKMHRVWARVWHQWSRLGGTLNGILQGTRVVKAFHGENREVGRFNRRITELAKSNYTAEAGWATFFPLVTLTMAFGTVLVWFVGGRGVLDNL